MKFTKIPATTFQSLQLNAGVLLADFNPATAEVSDSDLLGATTGGIKFTAKPTYKDMGEDIDNCPKNMKELKLLDSLDVAMAGTFLSVNTTRAKMLVGSADIDSEDNTKIVPRFDVKAADFSDIWWVGDYSDKNGNTNGGFIAIKLINALNTDGFSLTSGDKDKGQFAFNFTGHVSMSNQEQVPYEIYIKAGTDEPSPEPTPTPTPTTETATETFTGDGTETSFTLQHTPTSITSVTIGETETDAYTLSGSTITFTTAPENEATITVVYTYTATE